MVVLEQRAEGLKCVRENLAIARWVP